MGVSELQIGGLEPSNAARCGKGQKVCDDLGMGQYASGRIWIISLPLIQPNICVWYHVINNFTNWFHQHQAIHMYIQYYTICQHISNFSRFCYDMLWPPSAPRCSTSLSVAWPWTVDSCGTYIAGYYWFAMLCHFRKVTKNLIRSSRISQRLSTWHCFLVFSDLFQKVQRNCDEMALLSCWVVPSTSLYHVCRKSNSVADVHQLRNIMQPTMYCTSE